MATCFNDDVKMAAVVGAAIVLGIATIATALVVGTNLSNKQDVECAKACAVYPTQQASEDCLELCVTGMN